MLNGFDRAVGPVQPSEMPSTDRYLCDVGRSLRAAGAEFAPCLFRMYDGGAGKTYFECSEHNMTALAADWMAAHFGGGASITEALDAIRSAFQFLAGEGIGGIDEGAPHISQPRFGDVFTSIVGNLNAVVRHVVERSKETANGSGTEADHG